MGQEGCFQGISFFLSTPPSRQLEQVCRRHSSHRPRLSQGLLRGVDTVVEADLLQDTDDGERHLSATVGVSQHCDYGRHGLIFLEHPFQLELGPTHTESELVLCRDGFRAYYRQARILPAG